MAADMEAMVAEAARNHGLPASLVGAMVTVESSGDPRATRYEPKFYSRYVAGQGFDPKEARGRATSWGLMQVMGETARMLGFTGPFETLLDPAVGLAWGCAYLARLRNRYPGDSWETICRAYNGGPGNRLNRANTYPGRVLKAAGGTWPPPRP